MRFTIYYSRRSTNFLKNADKVLVKRLIVKIDKRPKVYD